MILIYNLVDYKMLCSLLKAVKLYFFSTALYAGSGSLYKEDDKIVAVQYALHAPSQKVDSRVTVVKDARYRHCFINPQRDDHIFYSPQVSFKVQSWKQQNTTPAFKPVAPVKAGAYYHRTHTHAQRYIQRNTPTPTAPPTTPETISPSVRPTPNVSFTPATPSLSKIVQNRV